MFSGILLQPLQLHCKWSLAVAVKRGSLHALQQCLLAICCLCACSNPAPAWGRLDYCTATPPVIFTAWRFKDSAGRFGIKTHQGGKNPANQILERFRATRYFDHTTHFWSLRKASKNLQKFPGGFFRSHFSTQNHCTAKIDGFGALHCTVTAKWGLQWFGRRWGTWGDDGGGSPLSIPISPERVMGVGGVGTV